MKEASVEDSGLGDMFSGPSRMCDQGNSSRDDSFVQGDSPGKDSFVQGDSSKIDSFFHEDSSKIVSSVHENSPGKDSFVQGDSSKIDSFVPEDSPAKDSFLHEHSSKTDSFLHEHSSKTHSFLHEHSSKTHSLNQETPLDAGARPEHAPHQVQNETGVGQGETTINVTETQFECIHHAGRMNELLRVQAGPGSGKTFTMVARIAQLLQDGARPEEILVLSMANKSVDALRQSLQHLVGPAVASKVEVCTFHSFCGGLLDQYGPHVLDKYNKHKTYDPKTWKTMTSVFSSKSIKFDGQGIGASITANKFGDVLSRVFSGKASIAEAARPLGINEQYLQGVVQYLSGHGLARYDELVGQAIDMMALCGASADATQAMPRLAGFKYVMVDEFQDMYPHLIHTVNAIVNYPTVGHARSDKKHLTIAGDPNQSIYGFLGSNHLDMYNIGAKIRGYRIKDVKIPESFRCTQEILDAASGVCLGRRDRDGERGLVTARTGSVGWKPVVFHANNEIMEQQFVAHEIIRLVCQSGGMIELGDIAILTRTNESALAVQSLLKTSYQLPSVKLSQGNLWMETPLHLYKDVLSVISGDTDSSFSLMSVIRHLDPSRGSSVRVAKMFNRSMQEASATPQEHVQVLETHLVQELSQTGRMDQGTSQAPEQGRRPGASYIEGLYKNHGPVLQRLVRFLKMVQDERNHISDMRQRGPLAYGAVELVETLARIAHVIGTPDTSAAASAQARKATSREALESFNNSLHHSYSKYAGNDDLQCQSFLDYFLKTYDQDVGDVSTKSVKISTIHSAKGLEFPVVFILGQTQYSSSWDNLLAAAHDDASPTGEETAAHEEGQGSRETGRGSHNKGHEAASSGATARLLYVAMTRARNLVYLGCRRRYEELSHVAHNCFTRSLPDLSVHRNNPGAFSQWETFAAQESSEILPNPEARPARPSHMQAARTEETARSNAASSFHESPRLQQGGILSAIAYDLKRGIPSQQKFTLGSSYYAAFSQRRHMCNVSPAPSRNCPARQAWQVGLVHHTRSVRRCWVGIRDGASGQIGGAAMQHARRGIFAGATYMGIRSYTVLRTYMALRTYMVIRTCTAR